MLRRARYCRSNLKPVCLSVTLRYCESHGSQQLIYELSTGRHTTFDDPGWHLKVISAYVVIPTSNISEIIYDVSTETEIANKKSHDSFQVIQLSSMTLAIFQGH